MKAMTSEISGLLLRGVGELNDAELRFEERQREQRERAEQQAESRRTQRVTDLFAKGMPESLREFVRDENATNGRTLIEIEGLAPIFAFLDNLGNGPYYRVASFIKDWNELDGKFYVRYTFDGALDPTPEDIGMALALAQRAHGDRLELEAEAEKLNKEREGFQAILTPAPPTLAERLETVVREIVVAVLAEREE